MAPKTSTNVVTGVNVTIQRPMVPGVLTNQDLQNKSVYRSVRSIVTAIQEGTIPSTPPNGSVSFGSINTSDLATDGGPKTFNQGAIDCSIQRVAPNGSNFGVENTWVAGGGITTVVHHLGRVPIGFIVIRNTQGASIWDASTPADATNYYFNTTHSNSDTYIIFI